MKTMVSPEIKQMSNRLIAVDLYPNLSAKSPMVKQAITLEDIKDVVMICGIFDFSHISLCSVAIVVSRNFFEKTGSLQCV